MPQNAKLVVIFNHRFERNLPLLRSLYRDRFQPTYLMPFAQTEDPDVTAVYASSHHFQGFVAQGYRDFRQADATHYVFVADDLLLHPRLDAGNIAAELGLSDSTGYIKNVTSLASAPFAWNHLQPAVHAFHANNGVEQWRELPAVDEATRLVARHGQASGRFGPRNALGFSGRPELRRGQLATAAYFLRHADRRDLPYPLLWAYSDFFVVPAGAMPTFARLCGVFAAMGLFVEVAVPTALALACDHLVTEQTSSRRGYEMWSENEQHDLEQRFGTSLDRLTQGFPDDWLYVHPVKLSKWRAE